MRAIPALDGLRGLAVALVVMRHAAYLGGYSDGFPLTLGVFMLNGWVGVDLFFVLSGFLISRPFFWGREFSWKPYLTRRALRIMPAYLFVLFLVLLGGVPLYSIGHDDLGWRVIYHLIFLQDYFPSDIVVAFWSLGVEEKFYLLVPVIVPLIIRMRNYQMQLVALVFIIFLGPLSRALTFIFFGEADNYPDFFDLYRSPFHACLDGLFFGVLLARIESANAKLLRRSVMKNIFWLGAFSLFLLMISHELLKNISVTEAILSPIAVSLIMALLVGAAVFGGAPGFFNLFVSRWLGRISYSIYLIHIPLIYPAAALEKSIGGGFFVFLLIYFSLVLLVSHLINVFIERPFSNLKERLAPLPER